MVEAICKKSLLQNLIETTPESEAFYYLRGLKTSFYKEIYEVNMYDKLHSVDFSDTTKYSLFNPVSYPTTLYYTTHIMNIISDKYYGVFEGYFIPTIEGEYRFWFKMDDDGIVYLDLTGDLQLQQDSNKLMEIYSIWTSYEDINFYLEADINKTDATKSKWLLLQKDKKYKFKAIMANTGGRDLFRLGVEIKNEAISAEDVNSNKNPAKIIQFEVKPKYKRQLYDIQFSTNAVYFYRDSVKLCEFTNTNNPAEILKCLQKTFTNREIIIAKVPLTPEGKYAFSGSTKAWDSSYSASYTRHYSFQALVNDYNLIPDSDVAFNSNIEGLTNFSLLILIDRNILNIAVELGKITFAYANDEANKRNFNDNSYKKSAQVLASDINEAVDKFSLTITNPSSQNIVHEALIKTNPTNASLYIQNGLSDKVAINRLLSADFCEYYIIIYDSQVKYISVYM